MDNPINERFNETSYRVRVVSLTTIVITIIAVPIFWITTIVLVMVFLGPDDVIPEYMPMVSPFIALVLAMAIGLVLQKPIRAVARHPVCQSTVLTAVFAGFACICVAAHWYVLGGFR